MEQKSTNPLLDTLSARLPGETFRLPSHGLFYTNNELSDDVKNGEVHVFPMTVIDEVLLKTPDKLMSGRAITEVFARCIPQVLKPMEMLSKDVDYLLMCLRLVSYGDTITVVYDHKCKNDSERHRYEVDLRPLIAATKTIDPTAIGSMDSLVMPSGQRVQIRPSLFSSVMKLYIGSFDMQRMTSDEQFDAGNQQLLDIVTDTIQSVDGIRDRAQIREWVSAIPVGWMELLSNAIHQLSEWGPSSSYTTKCRDCGEEITLEIPLNPISFFS